MSEQQTTINDEVCEICGNPLLGETWTDHDQYGDVHQRCLEVMSGQQTTERVRRYSHSALALYRLCPLRYRYHYIDHLEPIQPQSMHDLYYGSAWGVGLTTWYRDGDSSKALDAFAAAYPKDKYPAILPINSLGKTFDNGIVALADYILRWQDEDEHWTVLQLEERDTNDANDRILKLDMVVRDDRDGQVWGVENKSTSSYLDNKYWARFEPNSQVRMYADRLNERYGNCGGFIINAANFKHRSKAYTPRIGPDKGVQQPAGDWHSFARMTFNPNRNAIGLERDSSAYWVSRIEADRESGAWGYNDQSCHAYGRECEYYALCSVGYSWPQDEELILNYYRQQCPRVLDAGRCQLGLDHKGNCDPTVAVVEDYVVEAEEIEEAIK